MSSGAQRAINQIANIRKNASDLAQKVAEELGRDAVKYAVAQRQSELNDILQKLYRGATAGWYASYTPKRHKRNYSIYELMSLDGDSEKDIGWKYEDTKMTKSHYGGSLFDPVFLGGAHGLPHHSFDPPITPPVPTMFEAGVNARVNDIAAVLQPSIDEYFDGHFASVYERRLLDSLT